MTEYYLTIPGQPVAKARPRFFRRGNFVGAYNSQETEEGIWILHAMKQLKSQNFNGEKLDGPILLDCFFRMGRPMCHFGTGKNAGILKSSAPKEHICKPDVDNLLKFVMDCIKLIGLWKDDTQVIAAHAAKQYTTQNPCTVIQIRTVEV